MIHNHDGLPSPPRVQPRFGLGVKWRVRYRMWRHTRTVVPDAITSWELGVFSQNGEDGVVHELIRQVRARTKYFVEIGAGDGTQANCLLLADVYDWRGLFVEAHSGRHAVLERKYRRNPRVDTAQWCVTASNVDDLLRRQRVPPDIDVLSVDIDGNDYWVWKSIESITPRIVVIEYNGNLDPDRELVMPRDDGHSWDGSDYFGASLGAYRALAAEKGYRFVHTDRTGTNAFFVREEDATPLAAVHPLTRSANYFCQGVRLPRDPHERPFLDLETNRLVEGQRV